MRSVSGWPAALQTSTSSSGRRFSFRNWSASPWSTSISPGKRRPCAISSQASYCFQVSRSSPRKRGNALALPQRTRVGATIGENADKARQFFRDIGVHVEELRIGSLGRVQVEAGRVAELEVVGDAGDFGVART